MKIGRPSPPFRLPALVEGTLTYLDSARFKGRCVALCFLPPLGLLESAVLERYSPIFDQQKADLLGIVPENAFFSGTWHRWIWPNGLILLSDPLGRLSRSFGVSHRPAPSRCQSFVIDPEGILRYHLVHDLNGRGMRALLEILKATASASHGQEAPSDQSGTDAEGRRLIGTAKEPS